MKTDNKLDWRTQDTDTYIACCYGRDGDEPGEVEVQLQSADSTIEYEDGTCDNATYWRLYEPEAGESSYEMWDDETEAREALAAWCDDRDETPDKYDIIEAIRATGYFNDPDIIPLVIEEMTRHSQGYLLLTHDIGQPVGNRWTTNGYLQCDHIKVDATHNNLAAAADSLLRAIEASAE